MKKIVVCFLVLGILAGCRQDLPKPETIVAEASVKDATSESKIRHVVQGNNILIECIVPDVSFSKQRDTVNTGKAIVYMDGRMYGEYHTAAFIVKDLPKGLHKVKVDIVTSDNRPLGITAQFLVTID